MPENKVLAIKPINLGAAPEPTSGPIVLVDLCLTVDLGVGGWGTGALSCPSVFSSPPSPPHRHIHTLWSQVRTDLMSAGSAVSFPFVINNNRPPAIP